jgi:type IV secretion system protein VirB11
MENERTIRIKRKLSRELGPIVAEALDDPDVIEILLNPDGRLWVERFGAAMTESGEMTPSAAEALMDTIATALDTTITRENPILEGELPLDGSRFEGMISPVVSRPIFSIRKKAERILTLTDYIEQGVMTPAQRDVIAAAVAARRNILVVGGTGSGKTTLTNAIIDQMVRAAPDHRLVIIEDTQEIQCAAENSVILRTSDCVDMQRLLRSTMRLRPDRIIVGEVRGGEALTLLKSWNTGHPGGVCTLHANSALAGLIRLEQLIGEVTTTAMHTLIAEAVDLVILIEKCPEGRRIKEIIAVQRWDKTTEQYQYEPL